MLQPGEIVEGKYRLERHLGVGGMGSVWLATQLPVERPVAIKFLRDGMMATDQQRARFDNEARALARLSHPNCIAMIDYGYAENLRIHFLVMEYVRGRPLDQTTEPFPVGEVVSLMHQVGSALAHAHEHGILHRDLKPANVMIVETTIGNRLVKVLDFGLAKFTHDEGVPAITKTGEVFGTPDYMAPEQAMGKGTGPPTDLYALGVMAHELLTGERPFDGDSAFEVITRHMKDPPPPLPDEIPSPLQKIVFRLMEKDAADRYRSAAALVRALNALDESSLEDARRDRRALGLINSRGKSTDELLEEISAADATPVEEPSAHPPDTRPTSKGTGWLLPMAAIALVALVGIASTTIVSLLSSDEGDEPHLARTDEPADENELDETDEVPTVVDLRPAPPEEDGNSADAPPELDAEGASTTAGGQLSESAPPEETADTGTGERDDAARAKVSEKPKPPPRKKRKKPKKPKKRKEKRATKPPQKKVDERAEDDGYEPIKLGVE